MKKKQEVFEDINGIENKYSEEFIKEMKKFDQSQFLALKVLMITLFANYNIYVFFPKWLNILIISLVFCILFFIIDSFFRPWVKKTNQNYLKREALREQIKELKRQKRI